MDLPPNPPAYNEDSLEAQAEPLLDMYDEVPVSRLDKLRQWKQLLTDPCVELYAFLNLKWELTLARMGNPLIVKRVLYVLFVSLVFYVLTFTGVFLSDGGGYMGFTDHGPMLDSLSVDYKLLEESLEYLMSVDHVAGTKGDLAVAEYVDAAFKQSGMPLVQLQEMRTLLNFAGKTSVEYDDGSVVLDVTHQFNPLSFNGDAEGDLVYLHRGYPSDYQLLQSRSVEVQGKIGLITIDETIQVSQTALLAQEKGLKGIVFVDKDEGPYESEYERVSVAIPEYYTGDPLSPGWSSSLISTRLKLEETSMLKIPSVSLSREQAAPLFDKLNNKGVKFSNGKFSGGNDEFKFKLSNNVTYQQDHSIWNVLGKFEGKEQGDKALFIGTQRDSICANGLNPNSGTSIMLQLIKIMSDFSENFNWRPLRSVYFISFDAAEYNFAGVTELIEAKNHEVKKEAIAYLDLSGELMNGGDDLKIFTNGLLSELISSYSSDFNFSISKNFQTYDNFIPFMNLGIPVVKPTYSKSFNAKCQSKFEDLNTIDPSFNKHATLIKLLTRLILDIIDDPLIPFNVSKYVESLDAHLKSLESITTKKFPNSPINFNGLVSPMLRLKQIGKDFEMWEHAWKDLVSDDSGIEPSLLSMHRWNWNSRLNEIEKSMLDLKGNGVGPGRKWFRNVLSGPQLKRPEGDGDVDWFSFPSIRDVIDKEGVTKEEIEDEINRVGELIKKGNEYIVA